MASPFTFFRRNSHVTMVAVVILSMLAFTLDTLFSDRGTHFVLLGILIGAMIFSFFGFSRGQWIKFGIAGAVLGAACGFVLPRMVNPNSGFYQTSALGAFDDKRMMDLQLQRNIPNMFMQQAYEKVIAPGTAMYAPQFGFGHEAGTDDLTFAEMMRAEADSLGIVVTDKMVSDWINKQTQEKLSRAAFAEIRQKLNFGTGPISERQLLDCFGKELKALMAYQILRPQPSSLPQGPDVYYATFKRTKVRERLNTVRLDVDSFISEVADPTDAEISEKFQEGRLRFPNELAPGLPGFRQPNKAKLAYLEFGYKKVEASVTPPTDAEVEAFYKDNLDKLYRKPAEPAPKKSEAPAETPQTPGDASATEKPADEPKPEEPKPDEPKPEEPKPEEPKAEEQSRIQSKVDGIKVVSDLSRIAGTVRLTALVDEKSEDVQGAEKSETEAATPAQPAAAEPTASETPESQEFVIPKIEYKPLDDELKAEIREQMLDAKVRTALNDRLNELMTAVKKLDDKRSGYRFSLFEKNRSISPSELSEKMRESGVETLAALKALAAETGCEFVETPLLSYSELVEGESFPIGAAMVSQGETVAQKVFSAFPDDPTNDTTLFVGQRAVKNEFDPDGGETRYAWVITEYAPSHIPELDVPGIREQVVLALKREKARDLAKARGEELAKTIQAGLNKPEGEKKTMSETVEGQTVLGKADSPVVSMRQTLPFSWMEQSMTPQMNFMQQPTARLSSIRFADEIAGSIRYAGPKFMEAVFEDLSNNEVGVVPNEDFSSYYVVQVLERAPADENGEDILRQQFLTEGKQFGFTRGAVATVIQSDVAGPSALEWEKATWRKYGINPDEPQPE